MEHEKYIIGVDSEIKGHSAVSIIRIGIEAPDEEVASTTWASEHISDAFLSIYQQGLSASSEVNRLRLVIASLEQALEQERAK